MTIEARPRGAEKTRLRPGRGASRQREAPSRPDDFLVVGLGASAGGLEALDKLFDALPPDTEDADRKVVDRVAQVAAVRGIPRAQVALAWLLAKSVITAPIVGATKLQHLDDALSSVRIKLSEEEIALLEEPYVPHAVVGFD